MYDPDLVFGCKAGLPMARGDIVSPRRSLEDLFRGQVVESFDPPQAIFWQGNGADNVFHVARRSLPVYRPMPDVRRAIVVFIRPLDFVGHYVRVLYPVTAESVTPVLLRRLPRRREHLIVGDDAALSQLLLARMRQYTAAA